MNEQVINQILDILSRMALYTIVVPNAAVQISKAIKLIKFPIYQCSTIVESPTISDFAEEEKKLIREKIEKYKNVHIKNTIKSLIENVDPENINILYNNLTSVAIKFKPFILLLAKGGTYSPSKNEIEYSLISCLLHELIHLASSYEDPNTGYKFVGFAQSIKNSDGETERIGGGITEGYTALLTARYSRKHVESYKQEARIAELMEFFFDNPKQMENLFYHFDLHGLVTQLGKYSSIKEAIKLIQEIDYVNIFAITPTSIDRMVQYTKVNLKFYDWFMANNKDPEKEAAFKELLFKDKLVQLLAKRKPLKINRLNNEKIQRTR